MFRNEDTFTHEGTEFRVFIEYDDSQAYPWDEEDGHGPIRNVRSRDEKRPGERILHTERGTVWLYDWQAACKLARTDGWNAAPYDAPNRIERAVQADFDRMAGFLRESWCYVGVCVTLASADPETRYRNALWYIESDSPEYHETIARELASEILHTKRAEWRAALYEARERKHWAQRDVMTA